MVLLESPFHKERLAFADGSVIYGAHETPLNPTISVGRAYVELKDAVEGAEAIQQIDEFEELHPTLPGDEEEAAIKAAAIRTAALRSLLPLLDVNGDGYIDKDELKLVLPHAGDAEVTALMQSMDLDGDGRVSAEEWVAKVLQDHINDDADQFTAASAHLRDLLEAPFKAAIEEMFAIADKDESGELDIFEVTSAMYRMAGPGKGPKLEAVMGEFDADGNGVLDHDEFKKLFTTLVERRIISRPTGKPAQ